MRSRLLSLFLLLWGSTLAQEGKVYTVNSIRDNKEELIRDAYRYSAFRAGVVLFKDGVATKALLNYHRLYDQVVFISPKGETLALLNPETLKYVAIGADTFYVQDRGYLERLTHYAGINLARKDAILLTGYERKGAYGTYSATTSTESKLYHSGDGRTMTKLQVDENAVFKAKSRYFLSDEYHNFFPAVKKNFYTLFKSREKRLKEYLDTHKVNFSRGEDLLQLIAHLQEGD
ncbi:MAG TPA: hypothetical protein VGE66_05740 [Chitinophagaceae bacterium]